MATYMLQEQAREKNRKVELDRDGNKLWKLTKAMNDVDTKSSPAMIQRDQETVTGKSAANCFIDRATSKSATS